MSSAKITEVETLRQTYPEPKGSSLDKVLYELDHHCINFVSRSPFLVLGTVGDVSPKGDNPGFVRVLDSKKLLIPDRSGNNRLDSYQNILSQPTIAIIFFILGSIDFRQSSIIFWLFIVTIIMVKFSFVICIKKMPSLR